MRRAAVEIAGVRKRFGEVAAVRDVDLEIAQGEAFALIGHNGAGKSTLMRMMLGLLAPDAGAIRVLGCGVGDAGFRETRRRIAYVPENLAFYENLSGIETLRFFADLKGAARRTCRPLLERLGLARAAHRSVRGYSKGMRQRLGFAQALLGDPQVLFLDEPTNGLDPAGVHEFYDIVRALQSQGVTAVLSSHHLAQIETRMDRLGVMQNGRLRAVGTVAALRAASRLPLVIAVEVRAGADAVVGAALAHVPECEWRPNGARGIVRCGYAHKLAALAALAGAGGAVTDIHLREPSLEDVFLDYAENVDAPAGAAEGVSR